MRGFVVFSVLLAALLLPAGTVLGQGTEKTVKFTQIGLREGLSQSSVFSLCQDYLGFMWIGTRDGLNRYDSRKFYTYRNISSDSTSLSDNYILSLFEDGKKRLWIGTRSGLNRYDRLLDRFVRVPLPSSRFGNTPAQPMVWSVVEDETGRIWFATNQGLYCLHESGRLTLVFDAGKYRDLPVGCNNVQAFYEDSKKNVWLSTVNGVLLFEPYRSGSALRLRRHFRQREGELNSEDVRVVQEVKDGVFWLGTKEGGINVYNTSTGQFTYYVNRPEAKGKSIAGNDVRSIIKDRFGGYWIGTINGLNYYSEAEGFRTYSANDYDQFSLSNNSIRPIFQDARGSVWVGTYYGGVSVYDRHIPIFQNYAYSPYVSSLSYNVVSGILEDSRGNLWVGTEGGGLNYMDRAGHVFRQFRHDAADPGSLSHNHVKSLHLDQRGDLWVGTYHGGLNLLKQGSDRFRNIRHDPDVPNSLSHNNVYAIREDKEGNLWLGTYGGGLNLKKPGSDTHFESFRAEKTGRYHISSDLVRAVFIDSRGSLWVGTEDGLNVRRPGEDHFEVFRFSPDDPRSISGNVIISIFEDSRNRIWLGTYKNGLNLYDPGTRSFSRFSEREGLPGNNVFGILEDQQKLWLSTNNGICSFDPRTGHIRIYNSKDGIGGNEFSTGAYCRARDGQLIFGGTHGLTSFYPRSFSPSNYVPPIVFTDFRLFNEPVVPGKKHVLEKPISVTDTIVLTHKQNIFTVEFSAINYVLPEKNKYAYRLKGLENQWNYVDIPSATYTNLHAGTYTLLAKGSSNDGIWNEVPAMLTIRILPPPWKTWWAYTIYFALAAASIYMIIRFTRIRSRLEHELQLEHLENERQREINEIKLNFFTSISHEFRTPLTLILAPVQHLLNHRNLDENARTMMATVKNNSLRLLNLVNQLLDFRKQESGNFQLSVQAHDLVKFIDRIAAEFTHYAGEQQIYFQYDRPEEAIEVWFDTDQLEKVIYNLLSNAFKFVPEGGSVKLVVERRGRSVDYPHGSVFIRVWDNGGGIPADKLSSIFEFYYQLQTGHEKRRGHLGSGIGLALAKNLTEMHGGKIEVESYDGNEKPSYTCFTVELPLGSAHVRPEDASGQPIEELQSLTEEPVTYHPDAYTDNAPGNNNRPLILIVEDHEEIRTVIARSLPGEYIILEAADGQEGWELVQLHLPDLVITDIMMPVADGLSLLKNIKQTLETNHIPVLLLTARTAMESVIEGLQSGSDDYLTKPFHPEVLSLKIRNILAARERFRKKFIRDYVLTPQQEVSEPDAGQQFLHKVIRLIEDNLAEVNFNVNVLARELSMSRPVLYRKLKQLTDLSVIELINILRLKKAAQLLAQGHTQVSQVAYQIGFSDPKYFSKSFKNYFGKSPSEYIALNGIEQAEIIAQKFNSFSHEDTISHP